MAKYLVLAATSGIGQTTCQLLREQGHDLFVTGRSHDRIVSLAERMNASFALVDLTDFAATEAVFGEAVEGRGTLDGSSVVPALFGSGPHTSPLSNNIAQS